MNHHRAAHAAAYLSVAIGAFVAIAMSMLGVWTAKKDRDAKRR